jgi:hypothetical protein
LLKAATNVDETFPSAEAGNKLLELADDIGRKYVNPTWENFLQLRRTLDKIGQGKLASESPALVTQYKRELANVMRQELRDKGGEEAVKAFDELHMNILLQEAAGKTAAKKWFGRADLIPLVIGGGLGFTSGLNPVVSALTSVALLKTLLSPAGATAGSYGLKNLLGGAAQVVPRAVTQSLSQNKIEDLLGSLERYEQ